MAILAVQQISRAGLNPALAAAAAAGDSLPNTGRVFLRVKDAHAANARNVTVASQVPTDAVPQAATAAHIAAAVSRPRTAVPTWTRPCRAGYSRRRG